MVYKGPERSKKPCGFLSRKGVVLWEAGERDVDDWAMEYRFGITYCLGKRNCATVSKI